MKDTLDEAIPPAMKNRNKPMWIRRINGTKRSYLEESAEKNEAKMIGAVGRVLI
jgi:hypothetical protein